jgi:hypothetical protein
MVHYLALEISRMSRTETIDRNDGGALFEGLTRLAAAAPSGLSQIGRQSFCQYPVHAAARSDFTELTALHLRRIFNRANRIEFLG